MRDPRKYRDWLTIDELPAGSFFVEVGNRIGADNVRGVGFKTEYRDESGPICYCIESGERYWGRAPQDRPLGPRRCREWTPGCWHQGATHWEPRP